MRLVGALNRQPHRCGAGCQQQPVVDQVVATRDHHFVRLHVDADDLGIQVQLDAVFGVERIRAERSQSSGALPAR